MVVHKRIQIPTGCYRSVILRNKVTFVALFSELTTRKTTGKLALCCELHRPISLGKDKVKSKEGPVNSYPVLSTVDLC